MVEATYGLQPDCLPNARCGCVPNWRWVARHMQPLLADGDMCKFCGIKGHHSQLILAILQKFCDVKWEAIISATKISIMRSLSTQPEKQAINHRQSSVCLWRLRTHKDKTARVIEALRTQKRICKTHRFGPEDIMPLNNPGRAFCPAQKEAENDVANIA